MNNRLNPIDLSCIEELLRRIGEVEVAIGAVHKYHRDNFSLEKMTAEERTAYQKWHILKIVARITYLHIHWICARLVGFDFELNALHYNDLPKLLTKPNEEENCCEASHSRIDKGSESSADVDALQIQPCEHRITGVERIGTFFE